MSNSRQKVGCDHWPIVAKVVIIMLLIGGWGSISAQTDTEHEAEQTLRDLKIDVTPDPNAADPDAAVPDVDVPEMYKAPPKIVKQTVGGTEEWKLFYFCKYHKSDDLQKIIHEIFKTITALNPSKDAYSYWFAVNKTMLGFSKNVEKLWKVEKQAAIEAIVVAKEEALTFFANEREKIMRMSHEESLIRACESTQI